MKFAKFFRVKRKAAFIHFCVSLIMFIIIVAWMLYALYPSIFFSMSGGKQGLGLMLSVDVVLGPLLTFLVFNPQKKMKEIVGDFAVIGLVQLAALGYGLHTVYYEHPKLVVVYDMGSALIANAREVNEDKTLKSVDLSSLSKIKGVAIAGMVNQNGKATYLDIHKTPDLMATVDKVGRLAMKDVQDKAQLAALEKQYGKVFVMSTVGKYTGAYIILDKNFNYITKIGEKSTV